MPHHLLRLMVRHPIAAIAIVTIIIVVGCASIEDLAPPIDATLIVFGADGPFTLRPVLNVTARSRSFDTLRISGVGSFRACLCSLDSPPMMPKRSKPIL